MLTLKEEAVVRKVLCQLNTNIQDKRRYIIYSVTIVTIIFVILEIYNTFSVSDFRSFFRFCEFIVIVLGISLAIEHINLQFQAWQIRTGVFVLGCIVQANMNLYYLRDGDNAAVICYSTDERFRWKYHRLAELCRMSFAEKQQPIYKKGPEHRVGATLRSEGYQAGRRTRLPRTWTDGACVYLQDIYIQRKYLREGFLQGEPLLCIVSTGWLPAVFLVPYHLIPERSPLKLVA
jgi:hypothetical protein